MDLGRSTPDGTQGQLDRGERGSTLVRERVPGPQTDELEIALIPDPIPGAEVPPITYRQVADIDSPPGFRTLYLGSATLPILGYTEEEWRSDPTLWLRMTHPDDHEVLLPQTDPGAAPGDRFRGEYRVIDRDGRVMWFHDEAVLVDDPAMGPRSWQGVLLDVTGLRAVETEHEQTQAKYRNLVEQLPCVVYLAKYGEDGDWLYISPQLERVMGFTPTEWLEHPHPQASFTHPEDLARVRAEEERSLATGDPFKIEYRMQRRDGEWIWLMDEAAVVVGADGRPFCLQGLMFDITERRQAEERLVALDNLKNTLLHTLSHDLRSPLTAIQGAANTLERLDESLEPEDRRMLLRTVVERTKGMNSLLTDLLDLERLDSGLAEPRRFPVDLCQLVRDVLAHTTALRGRDVDIQEGRCSAFVDPPKVERIVENLVSNATHHTPKGSPVHIRCWREGRAAVIAVEDEGPGVPAGFEESLFEPFHRGPNAEGTPGSGIGLSLVARFAELHGGRAWVEQREGGGASFRVLLPDGDDD